MGQGVLPVIPSAKMSLLLILALTFTVISARPQFFPSESVVEDEIEGRHFINNHRRHPYNQGRPFIGQRPFGGNFDSFGGPPNGGLFSSGAGNFGPNGQFFGSNVGGGSATGVGMANSGGLFGGSSATGFGSASAGNGGGSAIGFGSANAGNGGAQATGIGMAQAPLGGFGMGVGLAVVTPFGNIAQGQGFSMG